MFIGSNIAYLFLSVLEIKYKKKVKENISPTLNVIVSNKMLDQVIFCWFIFHKFSHKGLGMRF